VKKRGLKTGLVTNAPGENVGAVLPALRLDDYFDAVVTAGEAGAGKPDPAPYRAALKKLAAEPGEALAFEDSVSGIASAVGAGIPPWASPRPRTRRGCVRQASSWLQRTSPTRTCGP
jgi:HAD superfamily hydrolase (TIGR01509 family)